ncbi:villin-1-like [Glycine soja]|uniref:Villin-1 isoform A n=1 Tax=Glycine soja TaxID=3848 RepID=A0A445JNK9_GLYSO|nr:villin-1-like [Glycine soja]RZC00041.1 Villin-1 isoform A [Glycine soja]RZC00042.1 Villin-1 isoform B [Glycine soja]
MPIVTKDMDSAFQTAGANPGLEVWCIENQRLVSVSNSSHGKFYTGSAYLVLNAVFPKIGPPQYDIHYWLGNEAKKVDSSLASDKALDLDAALGSCSVQYREIQGQESQKFLSYFRPCLIPIEGVFTSKQGNLNGEYQVSMYTCKGDYVVHVKEVPFLRSSLNHEDVFILDTALKIFLFSGCNSTIQERAKALEVVQYIKENKHGGKCEVATIEDGKFVGDSDVGEFWSLFGGYAPIPRDSPCVQESETPPVKLFWINLQGKLCETGSNAFSKEMLETEKCYMLDCDGEIFVWMGRQTLLTERRTAIRAVEEFVRNEGRSNKTHLTFLSEGLESTIFRSYFTNWPKTVEPRLYEEGKEKVAAIFKHQGYEVKELPEEDNEPSIDCTGTIKVWRVDGDELSLLSVTELTKLYSGDCYIVQYTFPGNGRDETLFYAWLGSKCVTEDKAAAISHMSTMADSIRTSPAMAQIHEGKEPAQFFSILQRVIIFKGGTSSGYRKFIEEKGIVDETYNKNLVTLFRVQGTSPDNMQAIQVDQVSTSLNSSYCYILQNKASIYTWIGSLSSARDHNLLDRMVELLNPTWLPVSVREGNEPDIFWDALGGKAEYPKGKEIQGFIDDPHLFALKIARGDFKVKEIYNYTQDDLITEDILLLDCQREIYVWVGLHSAIKSKQEVLHLGLKFLEMDVLVEGLSMNIPIYIVTEGHEPPFFTRFFSWDHSNENIVGNSFERKLAILKGKPKTLEGHNRTPLKANSRPSTPNGHRNISVFSNGRGRSSSPILSSAGSDLRQSGDRLLSSSTPVVKKLLEGSPSHGSAEKTMPQSGSPATELSSSDETVSFPQKDRNVDGENMATYPYERLRVVSANPVTGIDLTKREVYLSNEEFREKFGMPKSAFYKLPRWKQNKLKMSLDLF